MRNDWELDRGEKVKIALFMSAIVLIMAMGACSAFNKAIGLRDDNLAEEYVEQLIEEQTGIDMDLTPGTAEK